LAVIICASILDVGSTLYFPALTVGVCFVALEPLMLLLMMRLTASSYVIIPLLLRLGISSWYLWSPLSPRCLPCVGGMLTSGLWLPPGVLLYLLLLDLLLCVSVSFGQVIVVVALMWWSYQMSCFPLVSIWICLILTLIFLVSCLMIKTSWLKSEHCVASSISLCTRAFLMVLRIG
jgi:hypothetical protein